MSSDTIMLFLVAIPLIIISVVINYLPDDLVFLPEVSSIWKTVIIILVCIIWIIVAGVIRNKIYEKMREKGDSGGGM
jgi:ABC-type dipeptide/oligopeptide/nickel transport system permease subunit